ncbi:MAG: hypothetical protein HQ580_05515 [Planctomycetes bacterium]|nr:hypothetical protein [Planctomycetota bacterium]
MSQTPIEILIAAQKGKDIKVEFDIPVGDKVLKAVLTAPDKYEIQKRQDVIYRREFASYRAEGLENEPPNESEWKEEQLRYKKELRDTLVKPKNMAEQGASSLSKLETICDVLPKYVRDPRGRLLFPDKKAQEQMKHLLQNDMLLMKIFAEAYVELVKKLEDVQEIAKN